MVNLTGKDQCCKPRQMTSALSRRPLSSGNNKKGRPHRDDRPLVRYAPYSIPSSPHSYDGFFPSRLRHREASTGCDSHSMRRRRLSCPGEGDDKNFPKGVRSLSLSGVQVQEMINDNSQKRHQLLSVKDDTPSVVDVASDFKNSLVISDRISRNNQVRHTDTESGDTSGEHVIGFPRGEEWKSNAFHKSLCGVNENETKDKEEVTQDSEEGFSGGFLPSFDDAICFTEMMWPFSDRTNSSRDFGKDMKSSCRKNALVEEEDAITTLRKANTVVLFDDDEDDVEKFDFDFSGCLLFNQSSCEGLKAKATLDKMAAQEGEVIQRDNSVFGDKDSEELERRLGFHLDDILANDWLNGHQRLMTSGVPSYTDLQDMQGTYTCSVCSSNLEVDPFNTRGQWGGGDGNPSTTRDIVFPSWSSNQGREWRSHECDIVLFCPSCCSNRLVYHADRL